MKTFLISPALWLALFLRWKQENDLKIQQRMVRPSEAAGLEGRTHNIVTNGDFCLCFSHVRKAEWHKLFFHCTVKWQENPI